MTDVVNVFFSTYIYSYDIGFSAVNDWNFCWFNLKCRWSGGSCLPFATTRSAVSLSTSRESWEMMKNKNSSHLIKPWEMMMNNNSFHQVLFVLPSLPSYTKTICCWESFSPAIITNIWKWWICTTNIKSQLRYRKGLSARHVFTCSINICSPVTLSSNYHRCRIIDTTFL